MTSQAGDIHSGKKKKLVQKFFLFPLLDNSRKVDDNNSEHIQRQKIWGGCVMDRERGLQKENSQYHRW